MDFKVCSFQYLCMAASWFSIICRRWLLALKHECHFQFQTTQSIARSRLTFLPQAKFVLHIFSSSCFQTVYTRNPSEAEEKIFPFRSMLFQAPFVSRETAKHLNIEFTRHGERKHNQLSSLTKVPLGLFARIPPLFPRPPGCLHFFCVDRSSVLAEPRLLQTHALFIYIQASALAKIGAKRDVLARARGSPGAGVARYAGRDYAAGILRRTHPERAQTSLHYNRPWLVNTRDSLTQWLTPRQHSPLLLWLIICDRYE